jgi:hypothetical protein
MRKVISLFNAVVTLIPAAKGIRVLREGRYMPHIVLGDPDQRKAIVEPGIGIVEEYIGVRFAAGPETLEIGAPTHATLELMYMPVEEFSKIAPGTTFTLREGSTVVGFGYAVDAPSQLPNPDPNAIGGAGYFQR